jgi:hypothetical protein
MLMLVAMAVMAGVVVGGLGGARRREAGLGLQEAAQRLRRPVIVRRVAVVRRLGSPM